MSALFEGLDVRPKQLEIIHAGAKEQRNELSVAVQYVRKIAAGEEQRYSAMTMSSIDKLVAASLIASNVRSSTAPNYVDYLASN